MAKRKWTNGKTMWICDHTGCFVTLNDGEKDGREYADDERYSAVGIITKFDRKLQSYEHEFVGRFGTLLEAQQAVEKYLENLRKSQSDKCLEGDIKSYRETGEV